jgi:hypothetical protein
VAVKRPSTSLSVGIPYQLRALGWTRKRNTLGVTKARWKVLTPDVADIDSLGVLTPRKSGIVVVELSAGGWRNAEVRLRVSARESRLILDEQWFANVETRWSFFGIPKPFIYRDREGGALDVNGDGNFLSGAYFRLPVDARNGISVDFLLKTPITQSKWQVILVGLAAISDMSRLGRWDHSTGYIAEYLDPDPGCAFAYPAGEGAEALEPVWLSRLRSATGRPFKLESGSTYRVHLQFLPDGRCGTAIDGHAGLITQGPALTNKPYLLVILGSSVNTRILVGSLVLRSGVAEGMDWKSLRYGDGAWTN